MKYKVNKKEGTVVMVADTIAEAAHLGVLHSTLLYENIGDFKFKPYLEIRNDNASLRVSIQAVMEHWGHLVINGDE